MTGERSFDQVARRYQGQVCTLATYLLRDHADAEDITQEVLLKLWRHIDRLTPEAVRSWLLKVTRNACVDRIRKVQARVRVLGEHPLPASDPAAPQRSPEATAEAAQWSGRIRSALVDLPETMRSVLVLREIQGLSYREIAQVLDLSESNVRVTLHRGRRRLRDSLKEVYDHVAAC